MKWISVDEKLPDRGCDVLMNIVGYKVTVGRRYGRWQESTGGSLYDNKAISHWMLLPEPPNNKTNCLPEPDPDLSNFPFINKEQINE